MATSEITTEDPSSLTVIGSGSIQEKGMALAIDWVDTQCYLTH